MLEDIHITGERVVMNMLQETVRFEWSSEHRIQHTTARHLKYLNANRHFRKSKRKISLVLDLLLSDCMHGKGLLEYIKIDMSTCFSDRYDLNIRPKI